jgi:non-homologous end joining protein Ku
MKAWRNTLLRFGLVAVPVSLTPAKSDRSAVSAHRYAAGADGALVRAKQAWTIDGETLAAETVLAYDVDGEAVEIDAPEIDGAKGIELAAYVDAATIDPLFYDSAYCLFPGDGGAEGLGLIASILRGTPMMLAGTARFTDRPRSVVIRWSDAAQSLILHTLTFTSRVRFAEMLNASAALVPPPPALVAQAGILTGALPDTFLPADADALEVATATALHKARPTAKRAPAPTVSAQEILDVLKADVSAKSTPRKAKRVGMDRGKRGATTPSK